MENILNVDENSKEFNDLVKSRVADSYDRSKWISLDESEQNMKDYLKSLKQKYGKVQCV